jgi:hypothetical protein
MNLLDNFDEVRAVLAPYAEDLYRAMHAGFARFGNQSPRDKLDWRPTTQAGIVHDYQVKEIERLSELHEGLSSVWHGELFLLLIECKIAIKIKKLSRNHRSRSQQTQQVKDFLGQSLDIPGIPSVISLELGYTKNILGEIGEVLIVCPNGPYDNFWEWRLDSGNVYKLSLSDAGDEGEKEEKQVAKRYTSVMEEDKHEQYGGKGKKKD